MKTIIWLGESGRVIPNHGVTENGKEKQLPDTIADNFIKQNMAKIKAIKKKESE